MTTLNNKIAELNERVARLERGIGGRYYIDGSKIKDLQDLGEFIARNRQKLSLKRTRNIIGTVFVVDQDQHLSRYDANRFESELKIGLNNHFYDEDMGYEIEDMDQYPLHINPKQKEEYESILEVIENTRITYEYVRSPNTGHTGIKITFS